ncbi:MAG: iron-containing alcohol dehydrogenase [Peptococcaceae bacterium]|jgi:alcohol dehydrogenase class IV|nr:iron-containing alcohol dehydrogenase [Peptococcaceae bacterium]
MVSFHKQFAPLLFGAGASGQLAAQLKMMGCKKAIAVTDKGVIAAGVLDKALASLKAEGIPYVVYDGCLPDAPDTCFYAAADMARSEGVDAMIAVGGGSNIDSAKAASILIKDRTPREVLFAPPGPDSPPPPPRRPDVKLILIPTTCGTGSEETAVAVVSDSKTALKHGIFLEGADLSVVDPELTLGLPPGLTASTGMDVVCHACEAYTTTSRKNPISDQRAHTALRLAAKNLPLLIKDGTNLEARTSMSLACTWAGMAFNDSMNNLAHGIAHAFGSKSHLAHGIACALAEPPSLELFVNVVPELVRDIGVDLGADIPENAAPAEIARLTGERLRGFMREIGIPSFEKLGYTREQVMDHLDAAMQEFQVKLAPLEVTREQMETLLASMYDDYR